MDAKTVSPIVAHETWSEDLWLQAARGAAAAQAACTCESGYHLTWGILRAAGRKAGDEPLLNPLLSGIVKDGARILIAGAADTGTLCATGRAAGTRRPEITVLDRCPAPLRVIDDFAFERKLACRTLRLDLTELNEEERWDVILLHFTLWFIEPARRLDVLRRLSRALVPGGTLVCSCTAGTQSPYPDTTAFVPAWLERLHRAAQDAAIELSLTEPELTALLRRSLDATRERRRILPAVSEVRSLIDEARLVLTGETEGVLRLPDRDFAGGSNPAKSRVVFTAVRPR